MIPKIIHYCWFGNNDLPELAQKCIESWKKYCPDYDFIRWDESNYDLKKNLYIKQAYESKQWCFVSDYARLDVVYNYGGIYLDTDVELLRPIDDLLQYESFAGVENGNLVNFGLGFGAEKHSTVIRNIMKEYEGRKFIKNDGEMDRTPCPIIQTNYLKTIGFKENNDIQNLDGIVIFPKEYFSPKDFLTGKLVITNNTYSIHHYQAAWLDEYDNFCKRMRWKLSKYFSPRFSKLISIIIGKLKFFFIRKS